MKIAHVSPIIENTGGHRILYEHISRLKKYGHEVDIFAAGLGHTIPFEWNEIDIQFYSDFTASNPLRLEKKYDLIVANMLYGAINCQSFPGNKVYFYQNHDPFVFNNRNFDLVKSSYKMYQMFNKHMVYSHHLREMVLGLYPNKQIHICKNGVTYNKFSQFQRTNRNKKPRIALMIAYPGILKGLKLGRETFAKLKQSGFKTVFITALGENQVEADEYYLNPSFEDKSKILASCDILLHTSVFETFCMCVIECMSLGVPMVGTNSKGILEYCTPKNSIIVEERNPQILCEKIISLWENKTMYDQLVNNSIQTAKSHDWETIFPDIEATYKALV